MLSAAPLLQIIIIRSQKKICSSENERNLSFFFFAQFSFTPSFLIMLSAALPLQIITAFGRSVSKLPLLPHL